ncbi:hypothetical protein [Desulfoscipio gibsoniae]
MMEDCNWSQVRTFRQKLGLKKRGRGSGLEDNKKTYSNNIEDLIDDDMNENIGMIYKFSGIMDADKVLQRIDPITAIVTNCPGQYKVNICIMEIIEEKKEEKKIENMG